MRAFTTDDVEGWEQKINFVDENNVLLGYDMSQCCCEHADWFIFDTVEQAMGLRKLRETDEFPTGDMFKETTNLEPYRFDRKFYLQANDDCEEGNIAVFRIIAPNLPDKYITLLNCHNGYYSHGFQLRSLDASVIYKEGSL